MKTHIVPEVNVYYPGDPPVKSYCGIAPKKAVIEHLSEDVTCLSCKRTRRWAADEKVSEYFGLKVWEALNNQDSFFSIEGRQIEWGESVGWRTRIDESTSLRK